MRERSPNEEARNRADEAGPSAAAVQTGTIAIQSDGRFAPPTAVTPAAAGQAAGVTVDVIGQMGDSTGWRWKSSGEDEGAAGSNPFSEGSQKHDR
jgi:hypothetical protein